MRKFKINSAAISPSKYEHQVDEEFLQDVSSIITLEDGSSIDLKKAVLLYNPNTRQIQLSDSDTLPEDFIQLATLELTSQKPEVIEDESFQEPPEEGIETEEELGEGEEDEEEDAATADNGDSGEFFQ